MNLYEVIFAYRPDLTKEVIDEFNEKLKSFITDNKGEIELIENWGMKKLAYPVKKYYDADYYFFKFKLAPSFAAAIKDMLRLNEKVIRFNVMKIEKDFSLRKKSKKKVVEEVVVAPIPNTDEVPIQE